MAMSIIVAHGVAGDEIINEAAESLLDLRAARVARVRTRPLRQRDGWIFNDPARIINMLIHPAMPRSASASDRLCGFKCIKPRA